MIAEATNSTAITIVEIKIVFSEPRLVWNPAPQLSDWPKAPPALASDCWIRIRVVNITAKAICT